MKPLGFPLKARLCSGVWYGRKGRLKFDSSLLLPLIQQEQRMGLRAIEKLLTYLLVFKTPLNDIRLRDRFELAKPLQPELTHKR